MAEIIHALNRGVDGRKIFMDDRDRARFVHDMWEFNDVKSVDNVRRRTAMTDIVGPSLKDPLVDLHGWCLMGNHYHLLLSDRADNGANRFLRRLNVGYARYFNDRHERRGFLFQGRTKKIVISTDAHYLHILNYVHCNPLDFLARTKDWRRGSIDNTKHALDHLKKYRWSSYLDYIGTDNFPSILTRNVLSDSPKSYERELVNFLKDRVEKVPTEVYDLE